MRTLLLSLLILLSFNSVIATHNWGGYITYDHIADFTYEINLYTFTYPGSTVDRDSLPLKWGHGNMEEEIGRDSIAIIANEIVFNRYKVVHTFPGPGIFVVSMEDPNRRLSSSDTKCTHPKREVYITYKDVFNSKEVQQ